MKCNFICILLFPLFYFWLHWVLVALGRLSLAAVGRGYSLSWCTSFPLQGLLLRHTGSRCSQISVLAACRLSSCSMWALDGCVQVQLLRGMWHLPGPEMYLDQGPGSSSGPLYWKADSYPQCHQGSPEILHFTVVKCSFQEHGISFHLFKSTFFSFRSLSQFSSYNSCTFFLVFLLSL